MGPVAAAFAALAFFQILAGVAIGRRWGDGLRIRAIVLLLVVNAAISLLEAVVEEGVAPVLSRRAIGAIDRLTAPVLIVLLIAGCLGALAASTRRSRRAARHGPGARPK